MSYQIIFSPGAEKELKKLEKRNQERILAVLDRCKINPFNYVIKVAGTEYYRARAGKFRIIMRVEGTKLLILIVKIGLRESIYQKI